MKARKPKLDPLRVPYARFMDAMVRVGVDARDRWRWLTNFASRDLASNAACEAAGWELLSFEQNIMVRGAEPVTGSPGPVRDSGPLRPIDADGARKLQRLAQYLLGAFAQSGK